MTQKTSILILVLFALAGACGFPRPADISSPDVNPWDGGSLDGSAGAIVDACMTDADCHDASQSVCMSGRCLSPADACRAAGGARIVFLSNRDGTSAIYGAYADGSSPKRLAGGIVAEGNAVPSPDGTMVAFVQQSTMASNNNIALVGAGGDNLVNIASVFGQGSYIEWSPDGAMLVVGDRSSQNVVPSSVYAVKRDGHEQQLLGYADPSALNSDPSWSPDSAKIAFVSKSPSQFFAVGIWTIDADGNRGVILDEKSLLLNSGPNFLTPRWSPDRAVITYLSNENGNFDIVLKPLNGTAARVLATPANESDLAWSHDSSKLAFVRASGATRTIWVMNADGSAPTSVAVGEHPRWSSDDRYLLFETSRDGNREIYRMNSDGTNAVNLTNDPASDSQAEWTACSN